LINSRPVLVLIKNFLKIILQNPVNMIFLKIALP